MTAATLAHLPVAAGGAVLASAGRATLWAAAKYMRAPLANTAILALCTMTAVAGSNALYWQRHAHPAPLFAPGGAQQTSAVEATPVVPATRRHVPQVIAPLPTATESEATGSVDASPVAEKLGNAEVMEIQRKLQSMQLFDGTLDGLYGPRTARAIKAFETRMGLKPRGELTADLLAAVRRATVVLPEAEVEALPTPDPLPAIKAPVVEVPAVKLPEAQASPQATAVEEVDEPAESASRAAVLHETRTVLDPLPTPAPLVTEVKAKAQPTALKREIPDTPQEAMDLVAKTAGEAIDTIVDGVQQMAMTTPGRKQTERTEFVAEEQTGVDQIETASINAPQVGVPLEDPDETAPVAKSSDDVAELTGDARPEDLMPVFSVTDPLIVAKVQRGLSSLGFLRGPADGVAGEATAKAIRNFEVYFNYKVTGRISPELLDLLVQNGASL